MPTANDLHTLTWIFVSGGIGFFTGIAVTLSYEDLLDKKRRKTIKKLKARLAEQINTAVGICTPGSLPHRVPHSIHSVGMEPRCHQNDQ